MFECVIFDMDGVVIDSEPFHYTVNKEIFKNLNIDVPDKKYVMFIGATNTAMWTYLKKEYKLPQDVKYLVKLEEDGVINYLKKNKERPIDGVLELLKSLSKKEIAIALASSSPPDYIYAVLKSFDIYDYFKEVVSGEWVKRSKPAPDIFLKTADLLSIDPKNCVVIEDSENGVNAAKAAGMKCIGYKNPNSGCQDLSNADAIVDSLKNFTVQRIEKLF